MNSPASGSAAVKPKVYIHRVGKAYERYMTPENEAALAEFADVVNDGPTEATRTADDLANRISECSAILSLAGGWTDELTADVLKAAGTVKVICIAHWGGQLVDAAKGLDIEVTEGSNANTIAVVEWTLTAALMGVRKVGEMDRDLKTGTKWTEKRNDHGLLCESTIGLVGLGRIGAYAAQTFRCLGAKVIAYDPYWTKEKATAIGVTLVSLNEVFKTADVISLHLPVTKETTGMIGARELALIKDGAVFINSARASLTDEKALIAELKKERFSAYLDVFEVEPLPLNHPFRTMNNVTINPHVAGSNKAMLIRCGREAVETLRDYYAGKGLRNLRDQAPILSK